MKRFCTTKGTINKTTRKPAEREKVFANQIPDKGLVFKRCIELRHLKSKNTNDTIAKQAKNLDRLFPKEDVQVPEKMLNVTSHQGHASPNHSEGSPHPWENAIIKRMSDNKCRRGC